MIYVIKKTLIKSGKKSHVFLTNGYSEVLEIPQVNVANKLAEVMNENSDNGCSYEVLSIASNINGKQFYKMLDFDDLYERLVKNSGITGFINKKDIINKTKLHHYHHYKPNKNTKEFDYMALVMKSCIMNNYKNTQYRIKKINNIIKKLNKLGIY